MTDLATHLTAFLKQYLPNERRFSRHTVQSYTECFRLPVLYAAEQTKTRPCALKIEDFTVALLVAFLESLEKDRNNSVGTRNNRLAAIKAFFRYLEYRVPSCLGLSLQVRAIARIGNLAAKCEALQRQRGAAEARLNSALIFRLLRIAA